MSVLREITDAEYLAWLERAIPAYAQEKVTSGAWPEDGALLRSEREYAELLPQGQRTPGHRFLSILDAAGTLVGTLWFGVEDGKSGREAYVYNVTVLPEHRRQGHATRAFGALEQLARDMGLVGIALHVFAHNEVGRALYAKLGFAPKDFHLYKAV